MDENSEKSKLNELKHEKKELEGLLKNAENMQTAMEYQVKLDSVNKKIEDFENNNDLNYIDPNDNISNMEYDEIEEEPPIPDIEADFGPEVDYIDDPFSTEQDSNNDNLNEEETIEPEYDSNDFVDNFTPPMEPAQNDYQISNDEDFIDEDEMEFEDPNIIDAENYTITNADKNLREKAAEYAKLKAQNVKEESKNLVRNTAHKAKQRILNTAPFRIARGIGRLGRGIFRGFRTAGMITIGVGALSVDAVKKAKQTIDRASSYSIRDSVNNMRDSASQSLDKAIDRLIAQNKQLEEMQNQHTKQVDLNAR